MGETMQRIYETCPECNANGMPCHLCFGTGQVHRDIPDELDTDDDYAAWRRVRDKSDAEEWADLIDRADHLRKEERENQP